MVTSGNIRLNIIEEQCYRCGSRLKSCKCMTQVVATGGYSVVRLGVSKDERLKSHKV